MPKPRRSTASALCSPTAAGNRTGASISCGPWEIRREIGDRWGEAITICNLGEDELSSGRVESAREHFLAALEIRRQIGDRWGEAMALSGLGQAYQAGGRFSDAIGHLRVALDIHRELRDFSMEALDLHHLGVVYGSLDQAELSRECLRQALAIYQRLGMPAAEEIRGMLAPKTT